MIDLRCKICNAKFTTRIKTCPYCGGDVEIILDRLYKPAGVSY